jgi:hypothetical protein
LTGLRGRPAIDLEPIIETALKLAQMAADFGDRLAEIDINPLIAFPDRVVAVDALIVFT